MVSIECGEWRAGKVWRHFCKPVRHSYMYISSPYIIQENRLMMPVEFAAHLNLIPPTVKSFNLHFNHEPPENHDFPPDDITENNIDPLSSGLRGILSTAGDSPSLRDNNRNRSFLAIRTQQRPTFIVARSYHRHHQAHARDLVGEVALQRPPRTRRKRPL
ncbi:hypothetical protein BJX61DRAFT_324616 [Aspergillus egyptiacus]|nr:hypothetical protein BJX61DRAFT_324616 [Aspergillus egyptiacus]